MTSSYRHPSVAISRRAASAVHKGYPWVWRNAIAEPCPTLSAGDTVTVVGDHNNFVAHGLWDPSSPIAVRVYSRIEEDGITNELLGNMIKRASIARFRSFNHSVTNAYRCCNGEGDRVPGVVIDRYNHVAIVKFDSAAIESRGRQIMHELWPWMHDYGIEHLALRTTNRSDKQRTRTKQLTMIGGSEMPEQVQIREHGMEMLVDLVRGQKTGAFLDQRDNRYRVRLIANGTRVANLFSYTGGFSCAAALGGARHVTSVDIARGAHQIAQQTFALNHLNPQAHTFITADVFSFLQRAIDSGETYDLIISDPPSFAPNEKSINRALKAYRKLHQGCIRLLAKGATLCAASCSSHITMEAFIATLDDEVTQGRPFRIESIHGNAQDHPTLPSWPEGRYLKFVKLVCCDESRCE